MRIKKTASITAQKNKGLRKALLELLRTQYPGAIDLKVLGFTLDSVGYPIPADALLAHLNYLEEKGLLRMETRKGSGFSVAYAVLTAKGWDYLDGITGECSAGGEL
jgi:hypothetical protein